MINIKTPQEIAVMEEGGAKLAKILGELLKEAQPGVSLAQIETQAMRLIKEAGAKPSFTTVEGYKWATCLCVNEVVVHGIPTDYALREGDKLTIDVGLIFKGYHTDTAWTKIVTSGKMQTENYAVKEKFLKAGEQALVKAIAMARPGNHIGHISGAIQTTIEGAGYSVVRSLVGHGVGRNLHEPPQIPGMLAGSISATPRLSVGMTIAIEVIYAMGKGEIVYINDDGWSLATRDSSLAAVFERSVAITAEGPVILT